TEEFKSNIIKGLKYMIGSEGPYLFHCTEGKDRAGFMGALLGALMNASKQEIIDDYMQSYINYYGVEKGTDKYELITEDVLTMLNVITGNEDLEETDLSKGAESYLRTGGMTADEIEMLKEILSTSIKKEKAA
ncbi:MAG: tyrosine-protein phosphatase, partial [Halanaerobiales bacterium]|nr:tyrosine-protein phosphatase [Halanaerobiales bacterium]